jgi:hypothetical protein
MKGKLDDSGKGSVYVYYRNKTALYVGQTGRKVKSRLHDKTSPHKKAKWWKIWNNMRFMNLEKQEDRLVLEFLLILAYEPTHNKKPKALKISNLFCE